MKRLVFSILRYVPSLVSGEAINLGAAFSYPDKNYREFYHISKWSRISAFDDTINVPLLKDVMLDICDSMGTSLDTPTFDIEKFCAHYNSEIFFDKCITLSDVSAEDVFEQIEEIKKLYFQFEYAIEIRPGHNEQKKFLRRLLTAQHIEYEKDSSTHSDYGDTITYDYTFRDYGVVFFNLNNKKIDNKTMNKVKAWAWNAQNSKDSYKLVALYDLEDETRKDVQPALAILKNHAYMSLNIHDGFSNFSTLLEKIV